MPITEWVLIAMLGSYAADINPQSHSHKKRTPHFRRDLLLIPLSAAQLNHLRRIYPSGELLIA